MVNAGVVNARIACSNRAHFCKSLHVLGRIPRFRNPVKYGQRFDINHETAHFASAGAACLLVFV